jgi:RNA-dependent RNA polymerase
VGSDYKVQEEIARLSDALKDQFRAVCIEAAGSKDFAVLGPFVAGMYKVTKEELDMALAECQAAKIVAGRELPKRKMEPKHMPLISFPWLFEKELGRIATGIDTSDELEELGLTTLTFSKEPAPSRNRQGGGEVNAEDFIQQADGVIVHRGEELDLFRHADSDHLGESDYEDTRSVIEDHSFMIGDSGGVVLAAEFRLPKNPIPEQFLSGTGLEDLVARTELDGLIGPQEAARRAHESGEQPFLNASSLPKARASVEPTDGLFTPDTLSVDANDHQLLSLASNSPMPLTDSTPMATDGDYEADDSLEEEEVDVIVRESPLEKLARLVGDEDLITKDLSEVEGVVEEEEVMEVKVKESSL